MKPAMSLSHWKPILFAVVALSVVVAVTLAEPLAQDPLYHLFVDDRTFGAIPNFMNVASNFPFLLVGLGGLWFIAKNGTSVAPRMAPAWTIFFFGIALTTFGSGYYHWAPANGPLVWDRLPMTIGFMSLVAIVIAEYFSVSLARKLLTPLLIAGLAAVVYWSHTESLGRGDLRPYVIVQFLPILLIPLVITLYKSRSDLSRYIGWMIGFYVAAKVAEFYDMEVYNAGNLVSGHSLKHVIAALAPASLLYGLMRRNRD